MNQISIENCIKINLGVMIQKKFLLYLVGKTSNYLLRIITAT